MLTDLCINNEGLIHEFTFFSDLQTIVSKSKECKPGKFLLDSVPILRWLPKYKWKADLMRDLIAGFTVAVMHIPQGINVILLLTFIT